MTALAPQGTIKALRSAWVLVWNDHPNARVKIYTVWHPRNDITSTVRQSLVELADEDDGSPREGVFCIPGRREDGRDSAWFDAKTRRRVPAPRSLASRKGQHKR